MKGDSQMDIKDILPDEECDYIDTCWYNPKGVARPTDLRIDYEITDLRQLFDIV